MGEKLTYLCTQYLGRYIIIIGYISFYFETALCNSNVCKKINLICVILSKYGID